MLACSGPHFCASWKLFCDITDSYEIICDYEWKLYGSRHREQPSMETTARFRLSHINLLLYVLLTNVTLHLFENALPPLRTCDILLCLAIILHNVLLAFLLKTKLDVVNDSMFFLSISAILLDFADYSPGIDATNKTLTYVYIPWGPLV